MNAAAAQVLLLHPGAMGVTVGRTLEHGGHRVRWLADGRSRATAARADGAGFERCAVLREALEGVDVVVSVCPPDAALAVAGQVDAAGFGGIYLDANAISPDAARRIGARFGARYVDGGIIGPPADRAHTTRLYLSGPHATTAAGWFAAGPLTAIALDAPAGAASALKMCYAAYTKGSTALLLAVRALAEAEGVTAALDGEWAHSQPGLTARAEAVARGSAGKAWRFVGEMHEIAATFEAAGLPGGFHRAAADLYERLEALKDQDADLADVLARLRSARAGGTGPGAEV